MGRWRRPKEADIDFFFKALGEQKSAHIELAGHGYVEAVPEFGHEECTECPHHL